MEDEKIGYKIPGDKKTKREAMKNKIRKITRNILINTKLISSFIIVFTAFWFCDDLLTLLKMFFVFLFINSLTFPE